MSWRRKIVSFPRCLLLTVQGVGNRCTAERTLGEEKYHPDRNLRERRRKRCRAHLPSLGRTCNAESRSESEEKNILDSVLLGQKENEFFRHTPFEESMISKRTFTVQRTKICRRKRLFTCWRSPDKTRSLRSDCNLRAEWSFHDRRGLFYRSVFSPVARWNTRRRASIDWSSIAETVRCCWSFLNRKRSQRNVNFTSPFTEFLRSIVQRGEGNRRAPTFPNMEISSTETEFHLHVTAVLVRREKFDVRLIGQMFPTEEEKSMKRNEHSTFLPIELFFQRIVFRRTDEIDLIDRVNMNNLIDMHIRRWKGVDLRKLNEIKRQRWFPRRVLRFDSNWFEQDAATISHVADHRWPTDWIEWETRKFHSKRNKVWRNARETRCVSSVAGKTLWQRFDRDWSRNIESAWISRLDRRRRPTDSSNNTKRRDKCTTLSFYEEKNVRSPKKRRNDELFEGRWTRNSKCSSWFEMMNEHVERWKWILIFCIGIAIGFVVVVALDETWRYLSEIDFDKS